MTKYSETVEKKPKQKRKMVVESEKKDDGNKSDDNDFDALIKASVKEALHKDEPRPVHTSQAKRQSVVYDPPVITQKKNNKRRNQNKNRNNNNKKDLSEKDFPSLPLGAPSAKPIIQNNGNQNNGNQNRKNKNKNKNKNRGKHHIDFLENPIEEKKTAKNQPPNFTNGKKPEEEKIFKKPAEAKGPKKPVSYVEKEENPFAMKIKKSQKSQKNANNGSKNKKMDKDFPTLDNAAPSSSKGAVLGDTNKKDELEERFGIVINKKGKKKGGRR